MFNFRGFSCEFIKNRDIYGNIQLSVYDVERELCLYQLTEDLPYPVSEDLVVLKDKPFMFQFLAQMQEEGLIIGDLQRSVTENGTAYLFTRITADHLQKERADAGR